MSSLTALLNSFHGLVTQTVNIISKQVILQLVPKIFLFRKQAAYSDRIYTKLHGGIWDRGIPQRGSALETGAAEGKGELWAEKPSELGENLQLSDMDDKDMTGGFGLVF